MNFKKEFDDFMPELTSTLTIPNSEDWTVKGFIDYNKNIYSISVDTKVVSKIIELMIFPKFLEFAKKNNYELKLSPHQNYYPDITFINKDTKEKYAVDLKSTYRKSSTKVHGMTLGAYTGYFRSRDTTKNTLYPYNNYKKHFVFGVMYSRTDIDKIEKYFASQKIKLTIKMKDSLIKYINDNDDEVWEKVCEEFKKKKILTQVDRTSVDKCVIDETEIYNLDNFTNIQSVVKDFDFFIQEKWKIAKDTAGSGNTQNIGSINDIEDLKIGNGLFVREYGKTGEKKFDSYWMNFENKTMAQKRGYEEQKYKNLGEYKEWAKSIEY